jgi:hypothetical protein
MQLSIEIPEDLGYQLKAVKNSDKFIVQSLQNAIEENHKKRALKKVVRTLQQQAADNNLTEQRLKQLLDD